jgi:hypothetical protein
MKPYSYPLFFLCSAAALFGQTTATLTVTAEGTQPFSYSWKKDGAVIAGATSNPLVLSPLKASDTGAYSATVANAAGATTSPPVSLVVTAATSTTTPVDLSKQYAELSLSAPFTPAVAVFPDFVIVPLKKVNDPGSHFNDATGIYTVGPNEGGLYSVNITIRVQDQPPPNVSIGITSGLDNKDDHTLWVVTPGASSGYIRFGAEHETIRLLPAGAQIRSNIFVQQAIQIIGYDVTVRRLQ